MNLDASFLTYFFNAGLVVKCVLLLLVAFSIASWTCILQRGFYLKETRSATTDFESHFWAGNDLAKLYAASESKENRLGLETIFYSGLKEFLRLRTQGGSPAEAMIESARRAMHVASMREQDKLETHLPILATVGSISPYIGLFGTVWGIMLSLRTLAHVQQATVSMVAPGLAEALIATAMGLFVAIPAVIFYNRYSNEINRLMNRYDAFQEEFSNILFRQAKMSLASAEVAE